MLAVLSGAFRYFPVLLDAFRYFSMLFGTFRYFPVPSVPSVPSVPFGVVRYCPVRFLSVPVLLLFAGHKVV